MIITCFFFNLDVTKVIPVLIVERKFYLKTQRIIAMLMVKQVLFILF